VTSVFGDQQVVNEYSLWLSLLHHDQHANCITRHVTCSDFVSCERKQMFANCKMIYRVQVLSDFLVHHNYHTIHKSFNELHGMVHRTDVQTCKVEGEQLLLEL
jgi:hypothetical protein